MDQGKFWTKALRLVRMSRWTEFLALEAEFGP